MLRLRLIPALLLLCAAVCLGQGIDAPESQSEADAKNAVEAQRVAADSAKAEARIGEMRSRALANVATLAGDVASDIVNKLTGESAPASEISAAVAKALKPA